VITPNTVLSLLSEGTRPSGDHSVNKSADRRR